MTQFTEEAWQVAWLLMEGDMHYSRKVVNVQAGHDIKSGTVMATLTTGGDTGKWAPLDPAGVEGEDTATGIILSDLDTTGGADDAVMIVRHAQANIQEIVYPSLSLPQLGQMSSDLEAVGIILREGA